MSHDHESEHILAELVEGLDGEVEPLLRHLESAIGARVEQLERVARMLEAGASRDEIESRLEDVLASHSTLLEAMRAVSPGSRSPSPQEQPLGEALESLTADLRRESERELTVAVEGASELHESMHSPLYHLAREVLTSVLADADSSTVSMTLSVRNATVLLVVSEEPDSVVPALMDVPEQAWTDLRARVREFDGEMTVETSWREGTEIRVDIPLPNRS